MHRDDSVESAGMETQCASCTDGAGNFPREQVQFRNTVMLDIRPDEGALLAAMKQKTRYNIRLARETRRGGAAGTRPDLPALPACTPKPRDRDGFVIRSEEYYLDRLGTAMLQAGWLSR